jgi:SAM-dependent methyltransferase
MEIKAYLEMAELEERHWWFSARRDILFNQLKLLGLPVDAQILEVGCGTGGNLDMLSNFGTVCGLETSEIARAFAMKKTGSGVDIRDGTLPSTVPDFGRKFDLICLFDVLEHIDDDLGTLRALACLAKPGGRLIISVPAHQWLWSRHDEFLHHQRRYSKASLIDVVNSAGLRLDRVTYFNMWLFPASVLARGFDKIRGARRATGANLPPGLINGIMRAIFASERYLLGRSRLPFGLSLLCVARV